MRGKRILPIKGVKQLKFCCGPACMEMIFSYYGYKISQEHIKKELKVGIKKGMYPHQVQKYLAHFGIHTKKVFKCDVDKYFDRPRPLLLGLPQHFVLMIGRIDSMLVIVDPITGRQTTTDRDYLRGVKDYIKIIRVEYEKG